MLGCGRRSTAISGAAEPEIRRNRLREAASWLLRLFSCSCQTLPTSAKARAPWFATGIKDTCFENRKGTNFLTDAAKMLM